MPVSRTIAALVIVLLAVGLLTRPVAFLCSGDNAFVTGQVLNVDGGFASSGVMYDPAEGA